MKHLMRLYGVNNDADHDNDDDDGDDDDGEDDDKDDDDAAVIGDLILILFVLNHCLAFSICPHGLTKAKTDQYSRTQFFGTDFSTYVSKYFNSVRIVCP